MSSESPPSLARARALGVYRGLRTGVAESKDMVQLYCPFLPPIEEWIEDPKKYFDVTLVMRSVNAADPKAKEKGSASASAASTSTSSSTSTSPSAIANAFDFALAFAFAFAFALAFAFAFW